MLQVQHIKKQYVTGTLVQQALNDVSLNLRDNEFVAILGPSGSGKTTLLNIIGGLDRYDSGDLIINGVSTARYTDRDWDAYRNHTIGFVFQSYNLIPHQTVLENVELALTIGGISRRERKERAKQALAEVGLAEHMHKRPNQLSGGQMQRVAIARGLVNNPDILLADEPTGALDSETSLQVMDLLKEVAKDRLVVMVTHNPELAEQYANRIVRLRDGVILSDTNPLVLDTAQAAPVHRSLGRASMSFLTALNLSFNNLKSKLARTLMVAVAGSIGIIGIALIMSLSNGVSKYIADIEAETSSEYPLTIQRQAFSLSTMSETQEVPQEDRREYGEVNEMRTLTRMFGRLSYNDLESLKAYLDSPKSGISRYATSVEYGYNVTPQIFRLDGKEVRKVNPDSTFSSMGFSISNMFSVSTGVFAEMPRNTDLYLSQYDVKSGRWPTGRDELVVVLNSYGFISDLALYTLGLKDAHELDEMLKEFSRGEEIVVPGKPQAFDYDDLLGLEFKLVSSCSYYRYDPEYKVWLDKTDDPDFLYDLVSKGETLTIVGVVQPKEGNYSSALYTGINYLPDLRDHVIGQSTSCEVTNLQLADPDTNVMTGNPFGEQNVSLDLGNLFTVNTAAMERAFSFDASALSLDTSAFQNMDFSNVDFSDVIDPADFTDAMSGLDPSSLQNLLLKVRITATVEDVLDLLQETAESYVEYAAEDPSTDYGKLPDSVREYMQTQEVEDILNAALASVWNEHAQELISGEMLQKLLRDLIQGYQQYMIENGYSDPENTGQYIDDYLASDSAQAIMNGFMAEVQEHIAGIAVPQEVIAGLVDDLSTGYENWAEENSMPMPSKFRESFDEYINSEETQAALMKKVSSFIDTTEVEKEMQKMMASMSASLASSLQSMMGSAMEKIGKAIADNIQSAMTRTMESMSSQMTNAFHFNADAFRDAIRLNLDENQLTNLLTSMMGTEQDSYAGNLIKLGYADMLVPDMITIYPRDFDSKEQIIKILNDYNTLMADTEQDDKVITFTDISAALTSAVTDIVNTISYVLIAFVSISLIVSSIMIGVITYISVLERRKEIGILRAMGASKRNISQVFNAETFIIGLLSGTFGVTASVLSLIPINHIVHVVTDHPEVNGFLPLSTAIVLVMLSVILTLIGGIIPSRQAAKSDPVAALRSE